MGIKRILLRAYSDKKRVACMQRAGELLIANIICSEQERIQKEVCCALNINLQVGTDLGYIMSHIEEQAEQIKSVLGKTIDIPILEDMKYRIKRLSYVAEDTDTPDTEVENIDTIIQDIQKQGLMIQNNTELDIRRIHYYYNLEEMKESLLFLINNPDLLNYLRKHKGYSFKVLIFMYRLFFKKKYVVCYEEWENIHRKIDDILAHIPEFKKQLFT